MINQIGEFWGFQRAATGTEGHLTQTATRHHPIFRPVALPPAQSAMPPVPSNRLNKQAWGRTQTAGIMVHLEVTGKENRALRITNADRDKHGEALRNLDKGLSKHVRNWIHFPFLKHAGASCWRSRCCS